MSEEKNIPPEEIPQEPPVNEVPTEETISSADTFSEAQQTLKPLNELSVSNDKMEVHHHTHPDSHRDHGKKNWKSYFWEFLMLFLAVFCGFLAEYQLEHKIERDREQVYVQNLLEDLKADTAIYNDYTRNNKFLFQSIDTLIQLIKSPERKQHIAKLAFTARMILPKYKPLYTTDRTYEQMKSSGALRLIRNKPVANRISLYYYSVIDLKKYNDAAFTWGSDFGKEMGKIFDAELLLNIIKEKKEQPAIASDLLTEDRITLNELITSAQYLYGSFLLGEKIGDQRNIAAKNLIELIKNEYHLE
ncbi:MAG: hypothetical protein ABIO79_09280 [Ferruginibacter sp.]